MCRQKPNKALVRELINIRKPTKVHTALKIWILRSLKHLNTSKMRTVLGHNRGNLQDNNSSSTKSAVKPNKADWAKNPPKDHSLRSYPAITRKKTWARTGKAPILGSSSMRLILLGLSLSRLVETKLEIRSTCKESKEAVPALSSVNKTKAHIKLETIKIMWWTLTHHYCII